MYARSYEETFTDRIKNLTLPQRRNFFRDLSFKYTFGGCEESLEKMILIYDYETDSNEKSAMKETIEQNMMQNGEYCAPI